MFYYLNYDALSRNFKDVCSNNVFNYCYVSDYRNIYLADDVQTADKFSNLCVKV